MPLNKTFINGTEHFSGRIYLYHKRSLEIIKIQKSKRFETQERRFAQWITANKLKIMAHKTVIVFHIHAKIGTIDIITNEKLNKLCHAYKIAYRFVLWNDGHG
jgi:hypothetical protein